MVYNFNIVSMYTNNVEAFILAIEILILDFNVLTERNF